MNNIILIGMPASGKSTVGVLLAKTLGMGFIDTDLVIQKNEGKLLQEIIDSQGLESFLQAEQNAILSLNCKNTVIATGGSAVLCELAMQHLKSMGRVIYLNVDCKVIEKRLYDIETRGIACNKGETACEIFNNRKTLYEKYADYIVDTSESTPEQTVKQLKNLIK